MAKPIWPSSRVDGTLAVSIQLRCDGPKTLEQVRSCIAEWAVEERIALLLAENLASPPKAHITSSGLAEVVFDVLAGSGQWKALLVDLARRLDVEESEGRMKVLGFRDLVGGVFRVHDTIRNHDWRREWRRTFRDPTGTV